MPRLRSPLDLEAQEEVSSVLLSPHHDDECLFAAFTVMREKPKVIIVLESHLQEQRGNTYRASSSSVRSPITNAVRQDETRAAVSTLAGGVSLEFWPFRDDDPDWDAIRERIDALDADVVYAPCAYDQGGHEHHNRIGTLAADFAPGQVVKYDTYVFGRTRVTDGIEQIPEPWMVERKFRALACYRSQIGLWPHHFLAEQREYYA